MVIGEGVREEMGTEVGREEGESIDEVEKIGDGDCAGMGELGSEVGTEEMVGMEVGGGEEGEGSRVVEGEGSEEGLITPVML